MHFLFSGGFKRMIVCVPLEVVGIILFFAIVVGGYSVGYLLEWFAHWWWAIGICSLVRCVLMGIFLEKKFIIPDIVKTLATYAILFSNACMGVDALNVGFFDFFFALIFGGGMSMVITLCGYYLCISGRADNELVKYYIGTAILLGWAIICVDFGFDVVKAYF